MKWFFRYLAIIVCYSCIVCCGTTKILTDHIWEMVRVDDEDGNVLYDRYSDTGPVRRWAFTDKSIEEWHGEKCVMRWQYSLVNHGKAIYRGEKGDGLEMEILKLDKSSLVVKYFDTNREKWIYGEFEDWTQSEQVDLPDSFWENSYKEYIETQQ